MRRGASAPAQVVPLIVPEGVSVTGISVFHIVQNHTKYVGGAEALDGAAEKFAPGLSGSHDNHDSVGHAGKDVAVGDRWR